MVADLEGASLSYDCHGDDGPWITLIHGGLVASPSWRSQLPAKTKPNLARAGRLLCYDQRGYGASTGAGEQHLDRLACDVVELWRLIGIESSVVVGFSLGAYVALEVALQAPSSVDGLVLEGCGAIDGALRDAFAARAREIDAGTFESQVVEHVRRAFSSSFVKGQPENVEEYTRLARGADPNTIASTFRRLSEWQLPKGIGTLGCPVLIVSGDEDPGLGPAAGRVLRARVPRAEQVVFPHAGHTVHYESAPGFNHVVTDFVDTYSQPRRRALR